MGVITAMDFGENLDTCKEPNKGFRSRVSGIGFLFPYALRLVYTPQFGTSTARSRSRHRGDDMLMVHQGLYIS
jgi:hypothetical protein